MIASSVKLLVLVSFLVFCLAAGEDVCPLDYVVLQFTDGNENAAQRHRVLQEDGVLPPIEVIRQGGDYVDFIVHNTTAFGVVADHLFVKHQEGAFFSDKCYLHEDLGPIDAAPSATGIQRAHCIGGSYALVWVYARSTTQGSGSASIPKCCQDPYADTAADANTVKFSYELSCVPLCEDPDQFESTAAPTSAPTTAPTQPLVPRRSLQEEIIKDMMPGSSGKCSGQPMNSTYAFESSQAESQWNPQFVQYEEDLFLAKMQHIDNNFNRSWTIRFGQAGNIYSFVGPMGETVPPQDHNNAPWVDEVWQAVQPLGPGGDNDDDPNTNVYFIHEAGTYQRDGAYTAKPFYSPTLGSYCNEEDGECGFASWGQQAHVATPWKSPMLYLNRYINCGNGVFEYTSLRHNIVGSSDTVGYMNVPWGGTRASVLGDVVLTKSSTQEHKVVYPLNGWGSGDVTPLTDTMGYTIFAEDLPKNQNPLHDQPYPLPSGLDLTIQNKCQCENSCRNANNRYVCKLVSQPGSIGWNPNRGDPGLVVRLEGLDTGKSIVAGVRHWSGNGRLYFYQSPDLTLSKVQAALTPGTKVNAYHYYPSNLGKPEEDNLAMAHVHGRLNTRGGYPRVRFGAAGRDYNVYTINDVPTIRPGDTYYYRQYFMMDSYTEMRDKGNYWSPEATKSTKTAGQIAGRSVTLYHSDSGTFGHGMEGEGCRAAGAVSVCEGSTTPQSNWKPLFEIRCGDTYAVTDDLYHFSPAGPPYRSYVCDGMGIDVRPVWTLLGYFPNSSCNAITSNHQYDTGYC